MIKKRDIIILIILILGMSQLINAYKTNSSNYNFDFAISSGEENNITSVSYQNNLIFGIISESLNSTNYANRVGFLYTSFYIDGEQCFYDYECLGEYCCSNTCQSTSCPSEETPIEGGGKGSGGGGGGGAGTGKKTAEESEEVNLYISPNSMKITMMIGKESTKKITITNKGNTETVVDLEIVGLIEIISLSDYNFYLNPGESKQIDINIISDKVGIFSGNIKVYARGIIKLIPIIVEVETENALFDVKLDIPIDYKRIKQGKDLRAHVTLFNVIGNKVDVYAAYLIKDLQGNTLIEETETFMVDKQRSYTKKYYTRKLKSGTYAAIVEIRYANSYAVSSQMFEVMEEKEVISETAKELSILALIWFSIVGLSLIIFSRFKKRKGKK